MHLLIAASLLLLPSLSASRDPRQYTGPPSSDPAWINPSYGPPSWHPGPPHTGPPRQQTDPIADTFAALNLTRDAFGASVFAYLYGSPLIAYNALFKGWLGLSALGTNGVYSLQKPATAASTSVVRPNVDTIYAITIVDLSQNDLEISIPPFRNDSFPNRYASFALYDPFGDNYDSLGTIRGSPPGTYLLRPNISTSDVQFDAACPSNYSGCVTSPTYDGWMLARVEIESGTAEDIAYIDSYISQIKIGLKNRTAPTSSALTPPDLQNLSSNSVVEALQLTARLGARNPPEDQRFALELPGVLKQAGVDIAAGTYTQPPGVNLTAVSATVSAALTQFYANPVNNVPLSNGWSVLNASFSGTFINGTNVIARAFVADFGYGQNVPTEAIYPTPAQYNYTLASDNDAILISFVGGKPPLGKTGFWSLTLYDGSGFLVDNSYDVYALGDRSNLTYANGTKVYPVIGQAAPSTVDPTPFDILVQSTTVPPPANWTSNWLPAPASGNFQLTLRFYAPTASLEDGEYEYPVVSSIQAVT